MIEEKIHKGMARFYAKNKDNRESLKKFRAFTAALRSLRIPIYKNIFDKVHFRSYAVVLERIIKAKNPKVAFEWGPGLNSLLFTRNGAVVYSVEHNRKWFEYYKKNKPEGVSVIFSELRDDTYLEYPREIHKIDGPVDIAFVDARCRAECIENCKEKGVPLVVMHDSLHFETMQPATDGAPPVFNETRLCKDGYAAYKYFVEIIDFRTIVLVDDVRLFNELKGLFGDFYIESGLTTEYDDKQRKV